MEPIPDRIGRYVIESLVGAGGMGQIYKAHDPDIRRTVAIKLISTHLMRGDDRAEYTRRFRREAEAAARCAHPNIVAIYDFALHDGQPFLAMEFVYGMSVRQIIDEKPMALSDAIGVMIQVLDALASAHEQGVIHQDVKPANIMLTPQMRAKVTDFGISRFANTDVTSVSSSMGTPNYMSPEQCRGQSVDHRSDIFSAGATLFEMVAGKRAFGGRNAAEISQGILNARLPLLPSAILTESPRLQFVLERAMGKHPEDRFDSANEMAEALRQILGAGPESPIAPQTATAIMPREMPMGPPAPPPLAASAPAAPAPAAQANVRAVDDKTLQLLEEKFAAYLGPIARIMVRSAANRGSTLDALCQELAVSVPEGAERDRFRRDVATLLNTKPPALDDAPSHGSIGSLPEAELERAQRALTQYVGPIARVLVRRAARDAQSVEKLWQTLAMHIGQPTERAAFLRGRQE